MKIRTRWPEGTRVEFKPNAASLGMYSMAPMVGTKGSVVAVPLGRGKATYLKGPGGGLVYVKWDSLGVLGVSPIDVVVLKKTSVKAKSNPAQKTLLPPDSNPVLTAAERRALPASAFADPKNRRFPIFDMVHARAAPGKLNLWFKRGHISKDEYKEYYARIMKAYSRLGMTAHTPPLVPMPRVIAGGKKKTSETAERKRAVGENPASSQLEIMFPLRDKKQAHSSILILNNLFLKGKLTEDEYKHGYEMIASAWKKFGIKGTPSNELKIGPAPNPSKRHLSVFQPYSEDWRKRRANCIAQPNPAGPTERNDPSGMRSIMKRIMAKRNPASDGVNPQLATRMAVPEIGIEASSVGKNVSSIDPQEYFDAFLMQGSDPDAAMASLEDMASWGVTDLI